MTTAVPNERNDERRRRVLLGPLPAGFLQTTPSNGRDTDRQIAMAMEQQMYTPNMPLTANVGRLSMTIVQAKLVKNYGLTRMDPYVRLRVGHCIYETQTDPSGGKTPRWNKVVHCLLPAGVTSIYLEIFDECSFTMDELIAWTHITIPASVMNGETHEDWYPLNGKQGDGMEGMINLVISYTTGPAPINRYTQMVVLPTQPYTPIPVYPAMPPVNQMQQPAPVPPLVITDEQVKQIEEIFPSIEREVIKSVLEANNGNKDAAINSLLQMSE